LSVKVIVQVPEPTGVTLNVAGEFASAGVISATFVQLDDWLTGPPYCGSCTLNCWLFAGPISVNVKLLLSTVSAP